MIVRSKAVCIINKPFKLIQFLSLTVFTENLNPFNVPSNLIEDPFKIAVREFFLQCHDIQAISPGTAQYIYTLTPTCRLSFQQVVAICMDIFKTDRRTEERNGGQITSKRSQRRLCIIMPEHRALIVLHCLGYC